MSEFSLAKIAKDLWTATKKHSPEILTGVGIAGMITAGVMAVRATPKALDIMEEEITYRIQNNARDEEENIEGLVKVSDDKNGEFGHYRLPARDVIITTWKCYVPAVIISGLSIACLIGASSVNLRRNAALATAYTLSESVLKEYQEKVVETIGEKKEKTIRDKIAQDKVDKAPPIAQNIILTEKGNTLMKDEFTGRYFRSDIDFIKKIENKLNKRLISDEYISLNDFYYEVNLETVKRGEGLGWTIDRPLEFDFSAVITESGEPCIVIDYHLAPEYGYRV